MAVKYFSKPFGTDGDRTAIPNALQLDGSVSYDQGYTNDYQQPSSSSDYKPIERDKFNDLMFETTNALKAWQEFGAPNFITSSDNGGSPFPYAKNVTVYQVSDGKFYISLVGSNIQTPPDTQWAEIQTPIPASYYVASGTGSAYTINTGHAINAYTDGMQFLVKINTNSVTGATLAVDTAAAENIIINNGQNVGSDNLTANNIYQFVREGSKWFVTNPKIWSDNFFVTTGSANAYILTPVPAITAYTNGMEFTFQANFTNNSNCTINVSGVGAVGLSGINDVAFTNGEIINNGIYKAIFKTDHFVVINSSFALPVPSATSYGSIVVENSTSNGYTLLPQGSAGQALMGTGANAEPIWSAEYINPAPAVSGYGSLVIENSTSDGYALLTPGTTGKILQSNGSNALPTWVGQNMILLDSQTVSSVTSVTIAPFMTSAYSSYILNVDNYSSTTGGSGGLHIQITQASTPISAANYNTVQLLNGVKTAVTTSTEGLVPVDPSSSFSYEIIYQPSGEFTLIKGDFSTSTDIFTGCFSYVGNTTPPDGLYFFTDGSYLMSGTFKLYGIT